MTPTNDSVKTRQQSSPPPEKGEEPRIARVIEVGRALGGELAVDIRHAIIRQGELIVWRSTSEDVPSFTVEFAQDQPLPEACGAPLVETEPVAEVRALDALVVNSVDRRLAIVVTDAAIVKKEYRYRVREKLPMPQPPTGDSPPPPSPPPQPPQPEYAYSIIIREPKHTVES